MSFWDRPEAQPALRARHEDRLGWSLGCRVAGCPGRSDMPGTARGYCIRHYNRWLKHGTCQHESCDGPAISHIGMCEPHTPAGILR